MRAASVVLLPEPVGQDFGRNNTEHRPVAVGLLEIIAAEAAVFIHLVGKIEIATLLVLLPFFRGADLAEHVRHLFTGQGCRALPNRDDVTVTADFWGLPFRKVKVRGSVLDERLKKFVDVCHARNSLISDAADQPHFGLVLRTVERLFGGDKALAEEFRNRFVHEYHAGLLSCLDDARKHEGFRLADHIGNGW